MENREIEVRFLEINKEDLIQKIKLLGGEDLGERMLNETMFYDKEGKWCAEDKFLRIRDNGKKIKLSYKQHHEHAINGSEEIEFEISDTEMATKFLDKLGMEACRYQQKLRHTFKLADATIDIDTWPRIPAYVEIEGKNEGFIKDMASKLGLDWSKVVVENAGFIIQEIYKIPVLKMKYFTFDRFE